jgi:hypothetical protein
MKIKKCICAKNAGINDSCQFGICPIHGFTIIKVDTQSQVLKDT